MIQDKSRAQYVKDSLARVPQLERELVNTLDKNRETLETRMREELRFLTVQDQQKNEQRQLLQKYYPNYGTEAGFGTGMAGGMGAFGGGFSAYHLARMFGRGNLTTAAIAGLGTAAGYGLSKSIAEEAAGTATSMTGRYQQGMLNQYGGMAAYTSRSNWQSASGYIMPPELFRSNVTVPAEGIAKSWGLNPEQFLPGAMDLISQGIVAPAGQEKGRTMTTALKEAAEIFKSIQSFFGSVDIAGLSAQIKHLQAAGFTTEGMADLGRAMQSSTLAFAPENIRKMVYQAVAQKGSEMSSLGISASIGGQGAITGFERAHQVFGRLSDYERTKFRSVEQLGSAMTDVLTSGMTNPLLIMGSGDPMKGLNRMSSNFDLSTPQGMRDMRKAKYEVTSKLDISDQIKSLDNGIEQIMQSYGMGRMDAAVMFLGGETQAEAYMLERQGRQDTFKANAELLGSSTMKIGYISEKDLPGMLSKTGIGNSNAVRTAALKNIAGSGAQGQMIRGLLRGKAYAGQRANVEDLTEEDSAFGYFNNRNWGRMGARNINLAKDSVQNYFGMYGEDMFERTSERQKISAAGEVSSLMRGYEDALVAGPEGTNEKVKSAVRELGGMRAGNIRNRLKEELRTSGRNVSPEVMRGLFQKYGMKEAEAVWNDPSLRGQLIYELEREDKGLAETITSSVYSVSSPNAARRLKSAISGQVIHSSERTGWHDAADMLGNPIGIAATSVFATIGGAMVGGVAGAAKGFMYGGMAASAIASGLSMIGESDASYMNTKQAKAFDNSLYGLETVLTVILASMPKDMFSMLKSLTGSRSIERMEIVPNFGKAIYRMIRDAYNKNEDIQTEQIAGDIGNRIISELNSMSMEWSRELAAHLSSNPKYINSIVQVTLGYLRGTDSPADPTTVEQRLNEKVKSSIMNPASGGAITQRKNFEAARRTLEKDTGGFAENLSIRAAFADKSAGVRAADLQGKLQTAIDSNVKTASGERAMRIEDSARVYSIIKDTIQENKDADGNTLEAELTKAIEAAGFTAESGTGELIKVIEGVMSQHKSTTELGNQAKDILKMVLEDPVLPGKIKSLMAQPST